MQELIEFIAKKMVEHPEDVQVRLVENVSDGEGDGGSEREGAGGPEGEDGEGEAVSSGQNYELRVNPDDMGRIIGKNGRTAKAIRTLVSSAAAKANVYANLEIVE